MGLVSVEDAVQSSGSLCQRAQTVSCGWSRRRRDTFLQVQPWSRRLSTMVVRAAMELQTRGREAVGVSSGLA
jgi:hypothetical protein